VLECKNRGIARTPTITPQKQGQTAKFATSIRDKGKTTVVGGMAEECEKKPGKVVCKGKGGAASTTKK